MPLNPWPSDRARTFARLWRQGATADVIAAATNIKPTCVSTMAVRLRYWGYVLPHRRGGRGPEWTAERVRPVAAAIRRGADDVDLAQVMGIAPGSVSATLTRLREKGHAVPHR